MMFSQGNASLPATAGYFAWGCFSIFWLGHGLRSRSSAGWAARLRRWLRRGSLHSLRERRLAGPAGLEPATRPLWAVGQRSLLL